MAEPSNPLDSYSPFDTPDPDLPAVSKPAGSDQNTEEIRLWEERLNLLESQLSSQEIQMSLARESGAVEPPANWPKFYPLIHFDMAEVPQTFRSFVTNAMFSWCCMSVSFFLNFIGCLFLLRAGEATDSPGSKIALSGLYLFLLVPLALDLSALAVYRALKTETPSSLSFMKIFAFLGAISCFQSFLTIGFETSGSCGLITMLTLFFNGHGFIGFWSLITTVSLGFSSYIHISLWRTLWSYYRGTEHGGHIEEDMKRTFAMMVVDALK
jgi:hypothetical protein